MLAHVDEFDKSGLTVRGYSEKTGIPYYRLEYWRRRKREMDSPKHEEAPSFIQLKDQEDLQAFHEFAPAARPQVVMKFSNGLRLEIYS